MIGGYEHETPIEVGSRHLCRNQPINDDDDPKAAKAYRKAAYAAYISIQTLVWFPSRADANATEHLFSECGITPDTVRRTHSVQADYHNDIHVYGRNFAARLEGLVKEHGFSGGVPEFADAYARCQLMIALTFGYSDFSKGGHAPFPDMTVGGLLRQNAGYLRFHDEGCSSATSDSDVGIPRTFHNSGEKIDLLLYYTSMDTYHLLLLGWWSFAPSLEKVPGFSGWDDDPSHRRKVLTSDDL
jgi:hypothetical protein